MIPPTPQADNEADSGASNVAAHPRSRAFRGCTGSRSRAAQAVWRIACQSAVPLSKRFLASCPSFSIRSRRTGNRETALASRRRIVPRKSNAVALQGARFATASPVTAGSSSGLDTLLVTRRRRFRPLPRRLSYSRSRLLGSEI
jgi:hypothetical protein